jgi:hypothetical protein
MKTVRLELHDPHARGVVSRDGRRRFDARDHVVTVPAAEAPALLATPLASRYRPGWAPGAAGLDRTAEYEAWLAAHPDAWVPYATWYREHARKEDA